jgi:hypothetical protein
MKLTISILLIILSISTFAQQTNKPVYTLETKEDYAKHEKNVIESYNWLMKSPLEEESVKRQNINAFLLKWIIGSPNVSISLTLFNSNYGDCQQCILIFMGGYTKYALETRDFKDVFKSTLAGIEDVIKFYISNKTAIGRTPSIEKLIRLKGKNKLESYIKSKM